MQSTRISSSNLMLQTSPASTPPDSPRTPPPPKRGSTTSPGQEALATGGRWLAILVCCHHKAGLPTHALSLVSDLVQLLYYHGSGVSQIHKEDDTNGDVHLLSPVVQVSDCIPDSCHVPLDCAFHMWLVDCNKKVAQTGVLVIVLRILCT